MRKRRKIKYCILLEVLNQVHRFPSVQLMSSRLICCSSDRNRGIYHLCRDDASTYFPKGGSFINDERVASDETAAQLITLCNRRLVVPIRHEATNVIGFSVTTSSTLRALHHINSLYNCCCFSRFHSNHVFN